MFGRSADDGDPRNSSPVPSGVADDARSPIGHQDWRAGRSSRDHHPGGQIDAAPRRGRLGPRRRRVPSGQDRQRRGRSVQAGTRLHEGEMPSLSPSPAKSVLHLVIDPAVDGTEKEIADRGWARSPFAPPQRFFTPLPGVIQDDSGVILYLANRQSSTSSIKNMLTLATCIPFLACSFLA
jgi:hypothetical protein